jgi:hypothetical protein
MVPGMNLPMEPGVNPLRNPGVNLPMVPGVNPLRKPGVNLPIEPGVNMPMEPGVNPEWKLIGKPCRKPLRKCMA